VGACDFGVTVAIDPSKVNDAIMKHNSARGANTTVKHNTARGANTNNSL
jgi:hypothetical protein